jgi:hypothetical protein
MTDKSKKNIFFKPGRQNRVFYFTLIILSLTIMSIALFASSGCSMLVSTETSEKVDVENPLEDNGNTSAYEQQDTAALEEESIPEIDYSSATVAADMIGAIPSYMCTNKDNYLSIQITNTSDFPWRTERPGVVRIGYHYYGQDVDYVDYDGTARSLLPDTVNPGETVTVLVLINDIKNPGNYVIQIDPVIEGNENPESNFWFSSKGVKMIEGLVYFGDCAN